MGTATTTAMRMLKLCFVLLSVVITGRSAGDAQVNGDIISLIKALSEKIDGVESKVEKVAEDVKILYKHTIGPINKYGLTYIGHGHYQSRGGFHHNFNIPTLEMCFQICKIMRDQDRTWNGIFYNIEEPARFLCTCIRNDAGHSYQASQNHYRWV